MQIHDITKRRPRTDEGLLDTLKAGIAGAKAVGQAAMSPTFGAVTRNQGNLDAAEKSRQAINKKYGLDIQGSKRGAGDLTAASTLDKQAQAAQKDVQQQAQAMTQKFVQTPEFTDLGQVLPDPGQMLTVNMKGGDYYKDENGEWFAAAESNLVKPKQITADATIKALNDIIDTDQYKQVPSILAGTPPVKEAAGYINRRALAIKQAKDLVAKNVVPVANKNKVDPNKAFGTPQAKKAFDQLTRIAQAPVSQIKTNTEKKRKIKQAFTNYATATLTGAQGQQAQPVTTNQASNIENNASPQEKASAAQTITRSGFDGAKLIQATEKNPQLKQALSTITKESLEKKLNEALSLINESQVYITKDIRIRTTKGDYVKRASDQTWYDPNGVPIDPVKYADYIKKLDATPQAQTRYQADAKNAKGSDTALMKQQAAKQAATQASADTAPATAPDPVQQIADQQKMAAIMRSRDVAGLNAMINDTFNQLQNAKIFNTGQEPYLKDRMAQLMAMKV